MSDPIRILFFGTPEFAVPSLRALVDSPEFKVCAVVTQPDKKSGRGKKINRSPVAVFAEQKNIPLVKPGSIRKDEKTFFSSLKPYEPFDLGVVVAFGQILPESTLQYPKQGCVNVHASLLPRWRGAAPIHRAILAGDTETGICLMQMEKGLDTGAVYREEKTTITEEDTTQILHDRLSSMGSQMLIQYLPDIYAGSLPPTPQSEEGITYADRIQKSEQHIDWKKSVEQIHRTVRTFSPTPGAYSHLKGKRLKILSAIPFHRNTDGFHSGQISCVDKNLLEIQCGEGTLQISQVQQEGKKPLPVSEFLRGSALQAGDKFEQGEIIE